jgi:Flp pilus assembly protein TadG
VRGSLCRDDGSLTVELVALTPVLLFLALLVSAFGRISDARQQVVESARAGAEVAAVLPNAGAAQSGASAAAVEGSLGRVHVCPTPQVVTDASHFYPGGYVKVTVVCRVSLADLSLPGIPGTTVVEASSVAPIDPYRSVSGGFSTAEASSGSNPGMGGGT